MKYLEYKQNPFDGLRIAIRSVLIAVPLAVICTVLGFLLFTATASAYLSADNAKSFGLNKTWYGNWSPSAFCDTWNHCRAFPVLAGDSHRMSNGHYWVNVRKFTASGANCEAGLEVAGNDGSEKLADGFYVWGWIC